MVSVLGPHRGSSGSLEAASVSPISRGVLALLGIKPGVPAGVASHLAPSATPVTSLYRERGSKGFSQRPTRFAPHPGSICDLEGFPAPAIHQNHPGSFSKILIPWASPN